MKVKAILYSCIICIIGLCITNVVQAEGSVKTNNVEEISYRAEHIDEVINDLNNLPQIVYKNDENYILQKETENNCKYEFEIEALYKNNSDMINVMKSVWNIENEDYLAVCGINKNLGPEYMVEADKITYFVGLNSGNVILVPFQGGMEAYLIKDNNVINAYNDMAQSESYKWR